MARVVDFSEINVDDLDALRCLWLSRLMFGWMIRPEFVETRSFEDFVYETTLNEVEGER